MAVDDVYQVTMMARNVGGLNMSTLAVSRTSTTEPVAADFATFASAFKDCFRIDQSSTHVYTTYRARQVRGANVTWPASGPCSPVGGNLFEGALLGTLNGSDNGQALPHQCAMVLTLRSATVGRRHRGRIYIGGWGEANQDAGVWATNFLSGVDGRFLNFVNAHNVAAPTDGFRLGIWSFRTASGCRQLPSGKGHERIDPPNPAQAFTPMTVHTTRSTVYTQRRRVQGVGA